MGWGLLLYGIVVFPFLVRFERGFAVMVLLVWFVAWLARRLTASPPPQPEAKAARKGLLSESGLHDLLLLRLDLNRQLADGRISAERHAALAGKIDQLWVFHLTRFGVSPNSPLWNERREAGWAVLEQFSSLPLGLPPWKAPKQTPQQTPPPQPAFLVPAGPDEAPVASTQPKPALLREGFSASPPTDAHKVKVEVSPAAFPVPADSDEKPVAATQPKPAPLREGFSASPPAKTDTRKAEAEASPAAPLLIPGSPDEKIVAAVRSKLGQLRDVFSDSPPAEAKADKADAAQVPPPAPATPPPQAARPVSSSLDKKPVTAVQPTRDQARKDATPAEAATKAEVPPAAPAAPPPQPAFRVPSSPNAKPAPRPTRDHAREDVFSTPPPARAEAVPSKAPAVAEAPRPAPAEAPRPDYAWQPTEPSALEKALKAVSGWSAWLVPFLVQNIGWFVGGFCFITGSIFLITYTSGFANACAVFFVLLAYGALLLWGGYQLRSKRPELYLSSGVLVGLSTLLVPLCLASAMRMILAADSALLATVAVVVAAAYSFGAYWAATLALGMADRSLQGRHTALFLALSAAQWAVPALHRWPSWPLLAVLHLGLLGLLGHALARFSGGWLSSLFVEQRKTAYYAAGTLVYAALVSFVHLTFGAGEIPLPDGYFGPFLMALAGLLFQVDAELKHWSDRHVRLTRFSFALYGVSALALALAFGHVGATVVTTLVGVGVYASVIWRYLTFPPLVLFTVCAFWLYALLVLRHFDAHWHLLLSLPGLAALHALARRALARRSAYLAGLSLSCLAVTLAVLLGWSLGHDSPGPVALASVLAAVALVHGLGRLFPRSLLEPLPLLAHSRWVADGREIYLLAFLYSVGAAYAPPLLPWATQSAYGLVLLAGAWTGLGLSVRHQPIRAEAWLNCALLGLLLELALAVTSPLPAPLVALASCGAVLAWQSLRLYERGLFYLALLCWGVAGAVAKWAYFPQHGSGTAGFWLAFGLCVLAWRLERATAEKEAWRREQRKLGLIDAPPPLTLLGVFRVADGSIPGVGELLCPPLRQIAALLWLLGLGLWLRRLALAPVGFAWAIAALPGAFAAMALAGRWPLVPTLLGLVAALGVLDSIGFDPAALAVAALVYAALAWGGAVMVLARPLTVKLATALQWDLGLDNPERRRGLEQEVHRTSVAVALLGLAALPLSQPGVADVALALAVGAGFFHSAGWRYRSVAHSYLVLALAAVAALLAYRLALPHSGAALPLAIAGLAYWGLARLLMRLPSPDAFDASLYRKPLHRAALVLGWIGAALTVTQFSERGGVLDFATIATLGLSALDIRLANRRLAYFAMNACADLLAGLAVVWLVFWQRHGPAPFDPWADDVWITLALLAASASPRAASFFRIRHWPPLPLLLVLAAVLGVLRLAGFSPAVLCFSAVLYGWLAWRVGLVVFAHPLSRTLAGRFKLKLGLDSEEGQISLARDAHDTGVIVNLLGLASAWAAMDHPPLLALCVAAGFFYDAGRHYRLLAHSYAVLALSATAAALAYPPGGGVALPLTIVGLAYCGLARYLAVTDASLYRKPLRHAAMALGWIGAALTVAQFSARGGVLDFASIATLALSALGIRLANRGVAYPAMDACADLLAGLAVVWLEFWLRHGPVPFDPWADDVWITLALLAVPASLRVASFLRIKHWPPAPMLLLLAAALGVLRLAGFGPAALCFSAVLYGWLAWRVGLVVFAHPETRALAVWLRLELGLDSDENHASLARDVCRTGVIVSLPGLAVVLAGAGHAAMALPALLVGAGFFYDTGRHYRLIAHSYVVLALIAVAAALAYRLVLPQSGGMALASMGLAYWGLARYLAAGPDGSDASLYRKPLRHAAMALGWIGAALAVTQFSERGGVLDFATIAALGLSALGIRLANRGAAYPALDACADLLAGLAVVWLEFWLRHGPVPLDPWADDVWITLALLAAPASLRVASFLRIRHWPPAPMLLLLAAILGVLRLAGFGPAALGVSAMLYGWLAWRVGLAVFAHPGTRALAGRLELGLDSDESRLRLARDAHDAGVIVNLLGLALAWADHPPVLALCVAAGFFFDAGRHYRLVTHSYVVLALAVVGAELAYQAPDGLAQSGGNAVCLALLALAFWGVARGLAIGRDDASFDASLYRKPLHEIGLLLGWAAVALTLARVSALGWTPDAASVATLGLAALALPLLNHRLHVPRQELAAVWLAVLALLWLEAWLLHHGQPFDPWADPFGDIWISLALLAFGLALTGRYLTDATWRGALADSVTGLAALVGIRVFVPFALARLPVLLGFSSATSGIQLAEMALPALLGLMLPWTPGGWRRTCIAAWLCTAWTAYLGLGAGLFHPPLLFGLSCAGLLCGAALPPMAGWAKALEAWALVCLFAALALLPRFAVAAPAESVLVLALAAGLAVFLARRRESLSLLYFATALAAVVLHGWLWVWLRPASPFPLLPWYALQWALLLWLWPSRRDARLADGWRGDAQRCAWACRNGVVMLLVGELALHGGVWAASLPSAGATYGLPAHIAALAAGAMLLALESRRLVGAYDSPKVYALAVLAFAIAAYARLLVFGLGEPGLPDAAALILATFVATLLHRLTLSTPLLRIATFLPLLALLTVHWEMASASGSMTLLALGGVYVWLSHAMGKRLPVYLGLLFANIGVYLWVPYVAKQAHLLQVYVIPAAISVLLMLHLHKHELRPETLNASRLAATATLYGCATLDVFLRPEFGVFLLALGLSLASLVAGVALRVRAFVYSGLCFLVLNIAGQLGQLYPEGRLARAIVLMGLGSAITVAMIFFQLKRETVLRRIRMIRADLAEWE